MVLLCNSVFTNQRAQTMLAASERDAVSRSERETIQNGANVKMWLLCAEFMLDIKNQQLLLDLNESSWNEY